MLGNSGREILAFHLVQHDEGGFAPWSSAPRLRGENGLRLFVPGDGGEVIDRSARVAYEQRVRDLADEVEDAEAMDPEGEPRTASLLFTNRDRGPLTRAYYTHNAWKPALEAAGVERSRENGMHALRHHYASVLLERGVSIRAVAEYLGHHDPGFTLRTYAHLMPESEDRARAAIDSAHTPAEASRNANGLSE